MLLRFLIVTPVIANKYNMIVIVYYSIGLVDALLEYVFLNVSTCRHFMLIYILRKTSIKWQYIRTMHLIVISY